MPSPEQTNQIRSLAAQGESIAAIAMAAGLEIGDVESVLGGGQVATASAPASAGGPSGLVVQKFEWADEFDFPGTTSQVFTPRDDAWSLATVPAFTPFAANMYVELLSPEDPGAPGFGLAQEVDVTVRPVSGDWPAFYSPGATPVTVVGLGQPNQNQPEQWQENMGQNFYFMQLPVDVVVGVRTHAASMDGTTIVNGSKMRSLRIWVVTYAGLA